jgi:hypothetical protein
MTDRIIIIRDRQEKPPLDHSYEADVGRYWQRIDSVLLGKKSKSGRD